MINLEKQNRTSGDEEIYSIYEEVFLYACYLIRECHYRHEEAVAALVEHGLTAEDAERFVTIIEKDQGKDRQRWLILILVYCIVGIVLTFAVHAPPFFHLGFNAILIKVLFIDKVLKHRTHPITTNQPLDENMGLYQIQGLGFEMMGKFRYWRGTFATYRFFSLFWLPLFPRNCIRVKMAGIQKGENYSLLGIHYGEPDENYVIYSYEKWSLLEIISIYMERFGYTFSIVCLIIDIWMLFD